MKRDADRHSACLVCGSALAPARSLPGLLSCAGCSFVTADMAVSDAELERLYGQDYFHGQEYAHYVLEGPTLQHNFQLRLQTLLRHIGEPASKSLFEIGCAYGFFLQLARQRFARVEGIDISADAVRYAREVLGVPAAKADFAQDDAGAGFDVYCMWDTIEHVREPGRFIEKLGRVCNPGAWLAITTGDIGSLNARLRGRRWRMIHPPSHLHYFSQATLRRLLERHGFDVVAVEHPGVSRTLRMIFTGLLVLGKPRSAWRNALLALANRLPFADASVTLNLFDIMYVIARKRA